MIWAKIASNSVYAQARKKTRRKKRKQVKAATDSKPQPKKAKKNAFYASREWKIARYKALVASDGRCECCGASKADGAVLCVDHIKPLSRYPDLALVQSNLQVLCGSCNWGKGAWDRTDWRKPEDDLDAQYRRIMADAE